MTGPTPSSSIAAAPISPRLLPKQAWSLAPLMVTGVLAAALLLRVVVEHLRLWPGWMLRSPGAFTSAYLDPHGQLWASEAVPIFAPVGSVHYNRMHTYAADGTETVLDLGRGVYGYVFAVDRDGLLWISHTGGTIRRYAADGSWTAYEPPDRVFGLENMVIDWQGRVWVRVRLSNTSSSSVDGYWAGPITLQTDQASYALDSSALSAGFVQMLAGDDAGQVWVLQDNVLKVLGPDQTWSVVAASETACIRSDGRGQYWICGSQAQTDGRRRGIGEHIVRGWVPGVNLADISADLQGPGAQRWIATDFGLFHYDPAYIHSSGLLPALVGHLARFGLLEGVSLVLIAGAISMGRSAKFSARRAAKLAGGVAAWYVANTAALLLPMQLMAGTPVPPAYYFLALAVANVIGLLGMLLLRLYGWAAATILAYFINLAVILSFVQLSLRTPLSWGVGFGPFYMVSYLQCVFSPWWC